MSFSTMDDEYGKLSRRMNPPRVVIDNVSCTNATVIQLYSAYKQGILLEVGQILTDLNLMITKAYISSDGNWFMDVVIVFNVTDDDGNKITDEGVLDYIEKSLGPDSCFASSMRRSFGVTTGLDHTSIELIGSDRPGLLSEVCAVLTNMQPYSVVTIRCKGRPKLLDTVCTLTDMQYVVFHGNVDAEGPEAHQEDCIRHIDGSLMKSDAERQRVIQCLEAAIQRRVSGGLKLELCNTDRVGLLSDVTRIFRENSLTITRAEVSTRGGNAVNTFYVCDSSGSGYPVDPKIIVIPTSTNKRTYYSNAPPSWPNYTSIFASMDNQPEVRINISDGNTDLLIHQSWKEYKDHLKNSLSDDDATKIMSGTFMAVTGQVIGGVMVHRITISAASSYSWVEIATVLGLCVTLAGNSLRGRSRAHSALMIKIGAVITASAIVFSMGLHLPPAMALTVGPVMFLIMAVAAAFA